MLVAVSVKAKMSPTQLIFTTLDKARSKIPKDHYSKENGSREYYIKKIEIE